MHLNKRRAMRTFTSVGLRLTDQHIVVFQVRLKFLTVKR
jgi:hypothetical protein